MKTLFLERDKFEEMIRFVIQATRKRVLTGGVDDRQNKG
jgi:hypothetical protein